MSIPSLDQHRFRIAQEAYALIEGEVRPFITAGGRLWSKGSQGYPRRLRQILQGLDRAHTVTFATKDALLIDLKQRKVEHVVPMKRIVIEIVDPGQADTRSNSNADPIAGGPAVSPEDLISIFDRLLVKCWVTGDEHDRLNRAGRSFQWDAPDGDGWARYRQAGVIAYPLAANGNFEKPDTSSRLTPRSPSANSASVAQRKVFHPYDSRGRDACAMTPLRQLWCASSRRPS